MYLFWGSVSVTFRSPHSQRCPTPLGLSQGSVLRPLLYVLFTADIGTCSTGSQFSSASVIESPLSSGTVFLAMHLPIFQSSLSSLRPVRVADLFVRLPAVTLWYHMLVLPPDTKWLS